MKIFNIALLFMIGFVGMNAMLFPSIDKDILEDALTQHYQSSTIAQDKIRNYVSPLRSTSDPSNFTKQDLKDAISTARLIVPTGSKNVGLEEIQRLWPQAWREAQAPSTYSLKLYTLDSDGNYGFPFLHIVGTFNSTIECFVNQGCVFLNRRSSSVIFNGTMLPPTFSTALFLFDKPGELVGFDSEVIGSGLFGNAGNATFGPRYNIPIFRNVLNKGALITCDSFSSKVSPVGGDAGIGANYYNEIFDLANATVTLTIDSMFHIINSLTGSVILKGDQFTTTEPLSVPSFV